MWVLCPYPGVWWVGWFPRRSRWGQYACSCFLQRPSSIVFGFTSGGNWRRKCRTDISGLVPARPCSQRGKELRKPVSAACWNRNQGKAGAGLLCAGCCSLTGENPKEFNDNHKPHEPDEARCAASGNACAAVQGNQVCPAWVDGGG